jgi:Golgi apparatus protein 1
MPTYRCLIHNHDDLDPGCKKELGRAVHMAFFIWSPGAILTHPCDEDVAKVCLKARPNMDAVPGAVGSCLADIVSAEAGAWREGVVCVV